MLLFLPFTPLPLDHPPRSLVVRQIRLSALVRPLAFDILSTRHPLPPSTSQSFDSTLDHNNNDNHALFLYSFVVRTSHIVLSAPQPL